MTFPIKLPQVRELTGEQQTTILWDVTLSKFVKVMPVDYQMDLEEAICKIPLAKCLHRLNVI